MDPAADPSFQKTLNHKRPKSNSDSADPTIHQPLAKRAKVDSAQDSSLGLHTSLTANREPGHMILSLGKPSSQQSADRTIFRWNDLPGELKNRIYVYALTDPAPLSGIRPWKHAESDELLVNLFLVSKEIYAEGAPILYGANTFRFSACQSVEKWLDKIGNAAKWVKNITLELNNPWTVRRAHSMHIRLRAVEALDNFVVVNKCSRPLDALGASVWINQLGEASQWLLELGDNKADRDAAIDHIFTHAGSYDTLKPWIPGEVWGRHFAVVVSAVEKRQKTELRDQLKLQAVINARRLHWPA
ncbi:hypothetical protein DIS24_g6729 [Lasiodiplodia hormozganensis]|uniref:Uncharacterized protein n=1 Tax=Lasiodiplodia hormozganensis TaxID=869390 RepID=A0AA39YFG3_9PEZI|nr:hypothetical protein DIS24_g6729 [Lasiodiplodia hormozganensis]